MIQQRKPSQKNDESPSRRRPKGSIGTAWIDPEFEAQVPKVLGLYAQQLLALTILALIILAVVLTFLE